LKATQIKALIIPEEFSELDMWVNKILYVMRDYENDSKEVQLKQIDAAIIGVGTSKYVKDRVRNLVIQKLRL
jgi:hypothetical protein